MIRSVISGLNLLRRIRQNQFEKALAELEGEGLTSLVVDLRYNGGGLVDSVVQILDDILPEGLIVYTEDKNGHREEYRSSGDTHFDYPMAVLINQDSASASEILPEPSRITTTEH